MPTAVISNATRIWELNVHWTVFSQCGIWDPKGRGVDIWECVRDHDSSSGTQVCAYPSPWPPYCYPIVLCTDLRFIIATKQCLLAVSRTEMIATDGPTPPSVSITCPPASCDSHIHHCESSVPSPLVSPDTSFSPVVTPDPRRLNASVTIDGYSVTPPVLVTGAWDENVKRG